MLETIGKLAAEVNKIAAQTQKQKEITVAEAANLWNKLTARYDYSHNVMILTNMAKDNDLKTNLNNLLKKMKQHEGVLEKVMTEYAIPLPPKPPEEVKITENIGAFTDKYIFKTVFDGIQSFLPVHMVAFQQGTTPRLREMFKSFLLEEMNISEQFLQLGQQKNWLGDQPEYTPQ